ncbi:MAG TPA: hypothetical protein VI997_11560 [Candidatus Thermoplasmatota archaeon]|nr:hypothetical protein [Candidatus Thermoplasmatota archaeon]
MSPRALVAVGLLALTVPAASAVGVYVRDVLPSEGVYWEQELPGLAGTMEFGFDPRVYDVRPGALPADAKRIREMGTHVDYVTPIPKAFATFRWSYTTTFRYNGTDHVNVTSTIASHWSDATYETCHTAEWHDGAARHRANVTQTYFGNANSNCYYRYKWMSQPTLIVHSHNWSGTHAGLGPGFRVGGHDTAWTLWRVEDFGTTQWPTLVPGVLLESSVPAVSATYAASNAERITVRYNAATYGTYATVQEAGRGLEEQVACRAWFGIPCFSIETLPELAARGVRAFLTLVVGWVPGVTEFIDVLLPVVGEVVGVPIALILPWIAAPVRLSIFLTWYVSMAGCLAAFASPETTPPTAGVTWPIEFWRGLARGLVAVVAWVVEKVAQLVAVVVHLVRG